MSTISRTKSAPLLGVGLNETKPSTGDLKFPFEKTFFIEGSKDGDHHPSQRSVVENNKSESDSSTTSSDSGEQNCRIARKLSQILSKNKPPAKKSVLNDKTIRKVSQKNVQNTFDKKYEEYLLNWKEESSSE